MTGTNKRYLYLRSQWFESMYTPQGEIQPTRHTLFTLGPRMALDYTYLTWSTYSNLSRITDRFGWIPLLLRNRDSRLHSYHIGWPIYGSPPSFSPPHSQWSSRLKPSLCRWHATRLIGPIYQHAIGTLNTCSWGPTHWSLTDTSGGYNLGAVGFPHITPRPFQLTVSAFHLRVPPSL
jgi:hypothetical protein